MRLFGYLILFTKFLPSLSRRQEIRWDAPAIEKEHDPHRYTSPHSLFIHDTEDKVPKSFESPDFRIEEPFFLPHAGNFKEQNRPYRMSPHHKAVGSKWHGEGMEHAGCYCNTVYKRLTLLGGCAVITTRHVLTTATSTHLIMKGRYHYPHLEDILGVWYDTNHDEFNSSMYLTPAQIFYHPLWHYPEDVNISHPFSFTFDLAVWTSTHNVYGWYFNEASTHTCARATSHPHDQQAATYPTNELFTIVGFQFMYAYKRKPMPWFKYGIRTGNRYNPCPKTEWGWFLCIYAPYLRYGIESGAVLHRAFQGRSWRYDGLIGLGAFSSSLRTMDLVHYFTILDNHRILDFLFDCYRLNRKPVWADKRFEHPLGRAPYSTGIYNIPNHLKLGVQLHFEPPYD
ncbi:uncharacterized protein LOC116774798 [Danaus plexippus]|uniref:uncharacterized protein LOC116774798 n=1 Tax=Danaus plexippus TaxID=13037 RepID=UPI0013C493D4|nr:uncharacterized protein LOC116774798 [Danaus plexippus]